jgi:flagellum-specific peptidoglycan hydrolase FlgJ
MKIHDFLKGAVLLLAWTACETTGDPRQGGLFGWSEEKAQQRAAAQRTMLSSERRKLAASERTGTELRRRESRNEAAIREQTAELDALLLNVDHIERQTKPSEKTAALRRQIRVAREDTSSSGAEREARIRSLRQDVSELREELGLLQQRR